MRFGALAVPVCAAAVAVGLLTAFAVRDARGRNSNPDFFIYRTGAELALRGESPYDRATVGARVAEQYPNDRLLAGECGYFPPPMAALVLAPFTLVPWPVAKVLWALTNGLCAAVVVLALGAIPLPHGARSLLPLVIGCNYLTIAVVELGQTGLLCAACVAVGLWCFARNRPALGVLLWAVPFMKPHLALPLVPLAWYLGGWRRAAALAAVVAVLNLIGATVIGGSPLFLREYATGLGAQHKAVFFNRTDANPDITSWNRLLYTLTEPVAGDRYLLDLTAPTTVAGYLVWFALAAARCWWAGARPSPAWALAAAAVSGVLCAQVLFYELLWLVGVVPWARELFAGGRWIRGWLVGALLVLQLLPSDQMVPLSRSFGVAALAVLVLVGPVTAPTRSP